MTDPTATNSETRAIRKLTIAVWVLAILVTVNILLSAFALSFPGIITHRLLGLSYPMPPDPYINFHDWPLDKQVSAASVIAIAKFQKSDSTMKCIISEILKQAPNTSFYYKVGDEFRVLNQHIEANTNYGDGEIIFFTGSPAEFRFSTTFSNGRIAGMGDLPIDDIRNMIHGQDK